MERLHFRSTSLVDIQAELRERELLDEAHAHRRAARPNPRARTRLPALRVLGWRILG